jgi:ferrous iron transport protein A
MTSSDGLSGRRGAVARAGAGASASASAAAPEHRAAYALADLAPGARATVLEVDAAGSAATARRLAELGFTPGSVVEVVRRAPLHDPVIYRVKDYDVCLRRAQAVLVRTALVPAALAANALAPAALAPTTAIGR